MIRSTGFTSILAVIGGAIFASPSVLADAGGDAGGTPLNERRPSISVQNRALNTATLYLRVGDDKACSGPHKIASGEKSLIALSCAGTDYKLKIYDHHTGDWRLFPVKVERRYETAASGQSWVINDVTNSVTR